MRPGQTVARSAKFSAWPVIAGSLRLGAGMFAALVYLWYPGIMSWDAWVQWDQAVSGRYVDWHPPIMAHLWSLLSPTTLIGGGMFVVQTAFYCLAAALFTARAKVASGHHLLVFAAFAYPTFLAAEAFVVKDAQMASAIMLAAGLAGSDRLDEGRPVAVLRGMAVVLLLVYATLLRTNAAFAVAPIAAYAARPLLHRWLGARGRAPALAMTAGATLALVAVSLLAAGPINHRLLRAKQDYPLQSLTLFDIVGTASFSGDASIIESRRAPTLALVRRCYTPKWWDTLQFGECKALTDPLPNGHAWLRAVVAHPAAYLHHRIAHENYELRLLTPLDYPSADIYRGRPNAAGVRNPSLAVETIHWSPLLPFGIPAFWIVVDLLLLTRVVGRVALSGPERLAAALTVSALLYWAGFLLIGVADSYRYAFYPSLASGVALALFSGDHLARGKTLGKRGRYAVVAVALFGMILSALHLWLYLSSRG